MYKKTKNNIAIEKNMVYLPMRKTGENNGAKIQLRRKPYCTISILEYAERKGIDIRGECYLYT